MTKDIEKTIVVNTSPSNVYRTLMESSQHTALTGGPAEIENKEGGKFSTFGGAIHGKTTELIQDQKIVQKWRTQAWEADVYSEALFILEKVDEGTKITFSHTGIPDDHFQMIEEGWKTNYWEKMPDFFSK
jgi:activator of HSP90 ATPase